MSSERKRAMLGYAVLSPALIMLLILMIFPTVKALYDSFTDYGLFNPLPNFIGFENYLIIFQDSEFWAAFLRGIWLVVLAVGIQYVSGLSLALLLNENLKGMKWVKFIIMIPWVIPVVATVVMFDWMAASDYGLINMILNKIGLGETARYWFGDTQWAFIMIVIMHVWRNMPFYAITLYAGLKNIPRVLYEAAKIDGAGSWKRFVHITMPQLKVPSMIVIILHVLWTFNNFDMVYLSTGGGPVGTTEVIATKVYQTAWTFYEYGQASSMGIIMLLFMMAFSIIYIRIVNNGDKV